MKTTPITFRGVPVVFDKDMDRPLTKRELAGAIAYLAVLLHYKGDVGELFDKCYQTALLAMNAAGKPKE
jgi:hypothetical protein